MDFKILTIIYNTDSSAFRVFDKDAAVDSPIMTGNCEMVGSSTDSNASSEKSPLLPPPPAPPINQLVNETPKFPLPMPVQMNVPPSALQSNSVQMNVLPPAIQSSSVPMPLLAYGFKKTFNESSPIQLITSVPPPRIPAPAFHMPDFTKPPPIMPNLKTPLPPIRDPPAFSNNSPRLPPMCAPQRNPYPMAGPPLSNRPQPLMSLPNNLPGQQKPFPTNYQPGPTGFNPMINCPPAQPTYPQQPFRHPPPRRP